jgi:FkbM family methyltransferase
VKTFTDYGERTDPAPVRARLEAYHGRLAFDVGANTGQSARVLAGRFDRVVCFEPCLESAARAAVTTPPNVTVIPAAVSDTDHLVGLDESAQAIGYGMLTTGGHPRYGERLGVRWVPAVTLDRVCALVGPPDVVKIDTEGHELRVLAGAAGLIGQRCAVWLVEVHDRLEDAVRACLAGYRVTRFDHQPDLFYLEAVP